MTQTATRLTFLNLNNLRIQSMITAILSFLAGVAVGMLVFRKNRAKLDGVEAKTRSLLDVLKGR